MYDNYGTKRIRCICLICGKPFMLWQSDINNGRGKTCSGKCRDQYARIQFIEKFWDSCDKSTGCWLWTGAIGRGGYGKVATVYNGVRVHTAHRFSYMLTYGSIPDGLLVCHKCDIRHCINPDHLFLGTVLDNALDAKAKGRTMTGLRAAVHIHPETKAIGMRQGCAKLTDQDVREIRVLLASRNPMRKIAKLYCVSGRTIYNIAHGLRWTHVTATEEQPAFP